MRLVRNWWKVVVPGILIFLVLAVAPVRAGEFDDARVAFGAFNDGLYSFARRELETFLQRYPESEFHDKACILSALCCLEEHACQAAAKALDGLEKPSVITDYGIDPAHLALQLGLCFLHQGEPVKAEGFLLEVLKYRGKAELSNRARCELARIYFARPDYSALVRVTGPLLQPGEPAPAAGLDPGVWNSLVEMTALARYRKADYAGALSLFRDLLKNRGQEGVKSPGTLQNLYGLAIECAWRKRDTGAVLQLLRDWRQRSGKRIDARKLSAALLQVVGLFRKQGQLPQLEPYLKLAVTGKLPPDEKIAHYQALVEISRRKRSISDLRQWLARLCDLEKKGSRERINHLRLRLRLAFEADSLPDTVHIGQLLEQEDSAFWNDEDLFYPYLLALQRQGRCRELVERVPAKLPPGKLPSPAWSERRLALEMAAGDCLVKLRRWKAAESFYRRLFGQCREADERLRCLAVLARISPRLGVEKSKLLRDWLAQQLITVFPLDRGGHEKLLRQHPELVFLVADYFFRRGEYRRSLPSLLWLEKLKLKQPPEPAATFLLAETCYRMGDFTAALPRYEKLYLQPPGQDRYRHPAALRLLVCYEHLQPLSALRRHRLTGICRYLLQGEKDPALRRELRQRLEKLEGKTPIDLQTG